MSGNPDDVAAIERALVAIRRAHSRRTLARLATARGARAGRYGALPDAVFDLLDAVDAGAGATVTELAAALGVDQPRASRLAAQAIVAGLVERRADPADGRRSPLLPTDDGRAALDAVHRFRRRVVAEATAGWTARDRADLARLMTRLVADWPAAVRERGGGPVAGV